MSKSLVIPQANTSGNQKAHGEIDGLPWRNRSHLLRLYLYRC